MNLKNRIKTSSFWVSLASAVFLILNTIGKKFSFQMSDELYNELFTSFCGVLVLLGILPPGSNGKGTEQKTEIEYYSTEVNCQTSQQECDDKAN